MAKDDKKNAKNQKAEAQNKEPPKNDWKEQTKPDSGGTAPANNSGGCNSLAKVLIYLIPLALYVPWAYRMFKGNACCPEVPKVPTASMSRSCTAAGNSSYSAPMSRLGQRLRAPKDKYQSSCCDQHQYSEPCSEGSEMHNEHDNGKAKAVNMDKEREECLDQSKQCLEKCMEKCFDGDRIEKKKRKKRKEKKNEEDDEDSHLAREFVYVVLKLSCLDTFLFQEVSAVTTKILDMPPANTNPGGEEKKEPENDSQNSQDSNNQERMLAKLFVYGLPIAIWIPWAYRMFKGPKCCPEPPISKSRYGKRRGRGKGDDCGC